MSTSAFIITAPINNIKTLTYNILKALWIVLLRTLYQKKVYQKKAFTYYSKHMSIPGLWKILYQADSLGTVFNLLLTDSKKASQSIGISSLMGETFTLSSLTIWIEGIEGTAIQQIKKIDNGVIVTNTQESSTAQKKHSSGSTEKFSKKVGGKKVSSTLKQLIEELLTDIPIVGRSSKETSYTTDTRAILILRKLIKIVHIVPTPPGLILNLTGDDTDYMIAEVLKHNTEL
ncbi:hypothetical protein C2G38_2183115 [Gigaspora rosea]|uniref:Uncharacterized protein n=1 Tax=Gigaspora rosea TaxID=44941 RepID=A0A397VAJ6_9GLOM|nr:hypothetical protein C2G38_2183115 [Gigaspora rosea]